MNTKHRDRVFLWMILPALAGFMLLFIVPTLMSFAYSITNWSVYNPELRIVGIKNFWHSCFQTKRPWQPSDTPSNYAILINSDPKIHWRSYLRCFCRAMLVMSNILKSIFFAAGSVDDSGGGYLFQYIMTSADYGLLNNILQFFHLPPVNWLGDSNIALYSVLATQVWQWTGWSMVIYVAKF